MRTGLMVAALVGLSACGSSNPAADQLHNAAEQSDPAAAQVLENAAANAEASDANAADLAQNALSEAGQAQVSGNASGSEGAKPHEAGESVPPPKVDAAPPK